MQYKDELVAAADSVFAGIETRKSKIVNQIQMHAVSQIKDGYTEFRISRLKKSDERYLKEWADMVNATVRVIKFRCFANDRKTVVKQFIVDLKGSVKLDYDLEGKTLVIEI